jgi:hypothetical protein
LGGLEWDNPENGRKNMANVYVEPRPKGRPEGSHIDDYVVEDYADHVLATFKTQREAIEWAKKNGHAPHVARVRHLNDKKKADQWRVA